MRRPQSISEPESRTISSLGKPMSLDRSDKIKQCLVRAENLRIQAETASDADSRAELLGLELLWLDIAESYRVVDGSASFLQDLRARRQAANGRLALARRNGESVDATREDSAAAGGGSQATSREIDLAIALTQAARTAIPDS